MIHTNRNTLLLATPSPRLLEWIARTDQYSFRLLTDASAIGLGPLHGNVILVDIGDEAPDSGRLLENLLENYPWDIVIAVGNPVSAQHVFHWTKSGLFDLMDINAASTTINASIDRALEYSEILKNAKHEFDVLRNRLDSISDSEHQVMELVFDGLANKQIASKLSVSQRTIENRRQKIYQKMHAKTLAELIRAIHRIDSLSLVREPILTIKTMLARLSN